MEACNTIYNARSRRQASRHHHLIILKGALMPVGEWVRGFGKNSHIIPYFFSEGSPQSFCQQLFNDDRTRTPAKLQLQSSLTHAKEKGHLFFLLLHRKDAAKGCRFPSSLKLINLSHFFWIYSLEACNRICDEGTIEQTPHETKSLFYELEISFFFFIKWIFHWFPHLKLFPQRLLMLHNM